MRSFATGAAASMVAAAVTYVAFGLVDGAAVAVRLGVAAAVAGAGVVIAWAVSRRDRPESATSIAVGEGVRASQDICVEDVTVERPADNTRVGTGLRAGRTAHVRNVRIGPEDGE
jgi:hypothetical protein